MVDLSKTKTLLLMAAALLVSGCNGCMKPSVEQKPLDVAPKTENTTASFLLGASEIFAHANYFTYRSDMSVTTKNGASVEEDFEAIEINGAKPRIWLKKKIDSQHFIEIVAENDVFFVKSGGKEFRRGSDNTPLYQTLIDDGFSLLATLLKDFDLTDRVTLKSDGTTKKIYEIRAGPVSPNAPFVQALLKNTPAFGDVVSSDAAGSFSIDEKSNLPTAGTMVLTVAGKDDRSLTIKATFSLELRATGEQLAMPTVKDEEVANYPVDIGRRFNDLLTTKESK